MSDLKISDSRLALTQEELDVLTRLVNSGDRAGFYMAYYAMTGNPEAALQAKIATFSESEGGYAYAANWLLARAYGANGLFPGVYPGIYYLSQQVALSGLQAIRTDLAVGGTGNIGSVELFNSARNGWGGIANLFPGNIVALYLGGWTSQNLAAFFTQGTVYSALATIFAAQVGKTASDFSGYTQVQGPGGSILVIDGGRVVATLSISTELSGISNLGAVVGTLTPSILTSGLNPLIASDVQTDSATSSGLHDYHHAWWTAGLVSCSYGPQRILWSVQRRCWRTAQQSCWRNNWLEAIGHIERRCLASSARSGHRCRCRQ